MEHSDNPALRERIEAFISDQGDNALNWTETHGLLCATATGPQPPEGWQNLLLEDDGVIPADIADTLEHLRQRLATRLGTGERLLLPCRLDPYAEDPQGNDLTGWCAGFMAGVMLREADWFDDQDEKMANLLLPFLLISGFDDEDPALDELWQDSKLVRDMAMALPELLEELFLHFHAPETPGNDDLPEED